jgi:coenzyme F420-0:L-glutamate ligase/coenzyme F420-1:gamma-L-glutamate ligase
LPGLPLIKPGDDLAEMIAAALQRAEIRPVDQDILVVAQKVVSKAEGQIVDLLGIVPSARALALAAEVRKDPRLVEVVLSESTDIVRSRENVLIVAHRRGFVMANAGIDQSNVDNDDSGEYVLLLPQDADKSAGALKARLDAEFGIDFGIIINDSFGRPWRNGVVGVALGAAGVPAVWNRIGAPDLFGRKMQVTEVAVADELAAAASLLMGQADEAQPVVHVRGFAWDAAPLPAAALIRPRELDLFR